MRVKIDLIAILTCLVEWHPLTFVVEKHQPHWPLKIGIDQDLAARCPALGHRERNAFLNTYTSRLQYLSACVEGATRVGLDGEVAGIVTASEAQHAAYRFSKILEDRQAKRAEIIAAASAAVDADRVKRLAAVVAPAVPAPTSSRDDLASLRAAAARRQATV